LQGELWPTARLLTIILVVMLWPRFWEPWLQLWPRDRKPLPDW